MFRTLIEIILGDRGIPPGRRAEAELQIICSSLDLSQETYVHSLELLEELRDKNLIRGRSNKEIAAAIVYITARENREPRTLEEISETAEIGKKEIGKTYRFIARNTDVRIMPPEPEEFLERFAEKLGLSKDVIEESRVILERLSAEGLLSGKSPTGMAASTLYITSHMQGEKRSMKDISDTLGVTPVTIRNRGREIVETLDLDDVPDNLKK